MTSPVVIARRSVIERWLSGTWWVIVLPWAAIVVRLSVARTCADPYDLLPAVASNPRWVWPLAIVYLSAHVWMVAAYLRVAWAAGTLVPALRAWREAWPGFRGVQLLTMIVIFVIEYAPVSMWRAIGTAVHCGR